MKGKIKNLLVMLGWTAMTATFVLQGLFQGLQKPLPLLNVALLIVASIMAGLVLVDAEVVLYCYLGMILTSTATIWTSLAIPALLNVVTSPAAKAILYEGSIGITLRTALLYLMIPCFIGSIIGGIFGERWRLRYS